MRDEREERRREREGEKAWPQSRFSIYTKPNHDPITIQSRFLDWLLTRSFSLGTNWRGAKLPRGERGVVAVAVE